MWRNGRRIAFVFLVFLVLMFLLFHQNNTSNVYKAVGETVDFHFGINRFFRTAIEYNGRDMMNDPPIKFNPNFKNPCWYEGKQLRCLPYMFLIGVKKCGTGELFKRMAMHPDFIYPGFKEAQWFARGRFNNRSNDHIDVYINMFSTASKRILIGATHTRNSSNKRQNFIQITGEGSPSNLHLNTHWKYLPGSENIDEPKYVILDYIRHFVPNAKIIIILRDPVERLYSDYYHVYGQVMRTRLGKSNPTIQHFHEVVTKGLQAYKECFQHHTIRSCVYNSALYNETSIQIQLGIYYIYWQELLRNFPRRQILVLQNNKLHDMETTMKTVYKFLDLRKLTKQEMKKVVNARRSKSYPRDGPMFNTTLTLLQEFYAPFNKRMADITGDSNFLYGYE